MDDAFVGEVLELNFFFRDAAGMSIDPTSPRADVFTPERLAWLIASPLSQVNSGHYRLIANSIPSTIPLGTHYGVARGEISSRTVFSDSRPLIQIQLQTDRVLYATIEDFIAHSDCDIPTSQFRHIKTLIRAATRWIDRDCKTSFGIIRTYTDRFKRPFGDELEMMFAQYPVVRVLTVTPAGLCYNVTAQSGLLHLLEQPVADDLVVGDDVLIVYKAGWAYIPDDIHLACLKLIDLFFNMKGREGIRAETIFEYSLTIKQDIFEDVRFLISAYRKIDGQSSAISSQEIETGLLGVTDSG